MGITNIVKNIKEVHPTSVLCFRIGNFYHCYGKDSYILSYLFDYNVTKTKDEIATCGFPRQAISKVMARLEQSKVNYITFDPKNDYDVEEKQEFKNLNRYEDVLKKANKYVRIRKKMRAMTEELLQNVDDEETINKLRKIEDIIYEKREV